MFFFAATTEQHCKNLFWTEWASLDGWKM